MSVGDMIESLRRPTEETTTSDAITYLPSGFTNVKTALKTLSRMKKHWKINVIGENGNYKVHFDNVLEVSVQGEHWADFMNNILGKKKIVYTGNFEVDLGGYLKEAKDEDISKAGRELHDALYKMLLEDPIKKAGSNIADWNQTFRKIRSSAGDNVLIKFDTMRNDVQALAKKLGNTYSDDRGMLELITSAINQKRPLGTFEGFDQHEFLAGTRIESRYEKVPIAYEALVDMSFIPREHIVIQDQDVLDELQGTKGIKIATNTVFPVDGQFKRKHFEAVKNAIDDSITGEGE